MSPQQEALNNQVKNLPIIENLSDGQKQIRMSVESLAKVVEEEQTRNKEEHKEFSEEVISMKNQIQEGFRKQSEDLAKFIQSEKDDKIDELNKKLDRRNYVKDGIIITLVGGVFLAAALYLFGASVQ